MAARMVMVALFLVAVGGLRQPARWPAMVSALPYLSGVHRWRALTTDCLGGDISARSLQRWRCRKSSFPQNLSVSRQFLMWTGVVQV